MKTSLFVLIEKIIMKTEKKFKPKIIKLLKRLFDRPVELGAIAALKKATALPGVTERLRPILERDWQWVLSHLRAGWLVAAENLQKPGLLNCHLLVREYFGAKLHQENPAGWQAAHERLYRYYKALPVKKYPDTLAEMEPLFAAVAHGCLAGRHEKAEIEVYWKRIKRGNEDYCTKKLGSFGSDLACLSHFFEVPWGLPAAGLPEREKAVVLSWAAFGLRALGRLHEAFQPMQAGLEIMVKQKDWINAALQASNLSELLLTLGEVSQAVAAARQSVSHTYHSGDAFQKISKRATLADVLHQSGEIAEAEKWFREAEAMQKKRQPLHPYLYSLPGYHYCDLLLGQGKVEEVRERVDKALVISERNGWLLAIALDKLSLGRAGLLVAIETTPRETPLDKERQTRLSQAMNFLDQAVEGMRKANHQEFLVRGLLARAEGFRLMMDYARTWDDLNEALDIAEMGSMKLHLCDYHLEAGRLCLAEGKDTDAAEHFRAAKTLIEETSYHRRDGEVK